MSPDDRMLERSTNICSEIYVCWGGSISSFAEHLRRHVRIFVLCTSRQLGTTVTKESLYVLCDPKICIISMKV